MMWSIGFGKTVETGDRRACFNLNGEVLRMDEKWQNLTGQAHLRATLNDV